jgi:hypothetical protein
MILTLANLINRCGMWKGPLGYEAIYISIFLVTFVDTLVGIQKTNTNIIHNKIQYNT